MNSIVKLCLVLYNIGSVKSMIHIGDESIAINRHNFNLQKFKDFSVGFFRI